MSLCAEEIEQHQLIDQHYSAIAQTAAITQPHELPLSDAKRGEFESKFGVSWADALDVQSQACLKRRSAAVQFVGDFA